MEASESGDKGNEGQGQGGSGSSSSSGGKSPARTQPPADAFSVERLLGPDGAQIAQASGVDEVSSHALAGALAGMERDDELTRDEIRRRVGEFYEHVDTTVEETAQREG